MTAEIVERVLRSARYRAVDADLVARLAAEELPRARNADDAVKRVKRRLHQAVGAYRGGAVARNGEVALGAPTGEWNETARDTALRAMERHASTRERLPDLATFYPRLWQATGGVPASVLDLGCGLNPLALPFMALHRATRYLACDADRRVLDEVELFLTAAGQPHDVWTCDLAAGAPDIAAEVALVLKVVPLLDRRDADAATRLLGGLRVRHAVVSFPIRSLGGRARGMTETYRARMATLAAELPGSSVEELPFDTELVFVIHYPEARG